MTAPTIPPPAPGNLTSSLRRNIDALEARRQQEARGTSREKRIASAITDFTGSMAFVYVHLALYGAWVAANLNLIPGVKAFDPSFVILATEASVEAIFLSTFVLISQNQMARAADKRADLDLHINLLTEHELTKMADLITAMAAKMGIDAAQDPEIAEITRDIAPEAVLDAIERSQAQPH